MYMEVRSRDINDGASMLLSRSMVPSLASADSLIVRRCGSCTCRYLRSSGKILKRVAFLMTRVSRDGILQSKSNRSAARGHGCSVVLVPIAVCFNELENGPLKRTTWKRTLSSRQYSSRGVLSWRSIVGKHLIQRWVRPKQFPAKRQASQFGGCPCEHSRTAKEGAKC